MAHHGVAGQQRGTIAKPGANGRRPPDERRRVSLKEILRWAYSRQHADICAGTSPADGGKEPWWNGYNLDWRRQSGDGVAAMLRMRALGAKIDGGGGSWGASLDCHRDAATVHEAVMALGPINAALLIQFGHTGTFPEPCVSIARPAPFIEAVVNERGGRCVYQGAGMLYRIAVAEVIFDRKPVLRRIGRGKYTISHHETTRYEIEYCPLDWAPDPAWVEAVNAVAERWQGILAKLAAELAQRPLRDHVVAGIA